jgi:hypothetical protein
MNQNKFEEKLADIALKRLLSFSADQLVPFTWRKREGTVMPEGSSVRYTAMVLIGLQSAVLGGFLESNNGQNKKLLETLKGSIHQISNYGDMGLLLFAAALQADKEVPDIIERCWQQLQAGLATKNNPYETMWLAWLLDGFCAAAKLMPQDVNLSERIRQIAKRLLYNQDFNSGLFYRTRNWSNAIIGVKGRISFFSDQAYPIHALSSAYLTLGEKTYLDAANRCAQRLTELQGPLGEWWWVYHVPKGIVLEPFPVYSVHQHGMAPMALRQLHKAGGLDCETSCRKGISWLVQNQLEYNMVDQDAGLIWRSHRRSHLAMQIKTYNQIAGIVRILPKYLSTGKLEIDWECRPYELGWLLYAYSLKNL